jgi:signal transduction histidine kinase
MNESKKIKYRKILIAVFLILSIIQLTNAQNDRIVSITDIYLNGEKWLGNDHEIIAGNDDSLTFHYELLSPTNATDKFFYRIMLKDERDSNVRNVNSDYASYVNLPEGKWIFEAGAFDLKGKWVAYPNSVLIDINNQKKIMKQHHSSFISNYKSRDTLIGTPKESKIQRIFSPIIISITIGIILLVLISFIFLKSKIKHNIDEEEMAEKPETVAKEEFDKVATENSALRAEIAALRGQIGAMQTRSEQLQKQNSELQKSLAKIESSKSEVEDLQKQKDELFAVIIHDIKNPVALIKSLVELLSSYDLTATEQQEVIQDIAQTTIKIVSLSQDVSKILTFESNKMNLNFEQNDFTEIVEDVYQRNLIGARNKNIGMTTEIDDTLPEAVFDSQKIDEVIDNLVSNAIKFTQPGGTILIKTEKEDDNIKLSVSDNGQGLSEEDIKHAFKRGSKLTARPTGGESSTGLGLWIVRKLIESHKGKVWVKSAVGKGSTFSFLIPISQKVDQEA